MCVIFETRLGFQLTNEADNVTRAMNHLRGGTVYVDSIRLKIREGLSAVLDVG